MAIVTESLRPQYCEDVIFGVLWRWNWALTDRGEFQPCDLKPYCPKCGAESIIALNAPGFAAPQPNTFFDCPKDPLHQYPHTWLKGNELEALEFMVGHIRENYMTGTRGPKSAREAIARTPEYWSDTGPLDGPITADSDIRMLNVFDAQSGGTAIGQAYRVGEFVTRDGNVAVFRIETDHGSIVGPYYCLSRRLLILGGSVEGP